MKTTIILLEIYPDLHRLTVTGQHGGGSSRTLKKQRPDQLAALCAQAMLDYGAPNPEGADLMAPPEVLELVPEHLRGIPAQAAEKTGL